MSVGYQSAHAASTEGTTGAASQRKLTAKKKKQSKEVSSSKSASPTKAKSVYPPWHNVVAGATAGAGARLFTAPLDLIKIRRQLNPTVVSSGVPNFSPVGFFRSLQQIVQKEGGLKSLFRGNLAATYLWIGYAAVQFSLYARTADFLSHASSMPMQLPPTLPAPIVQPAQLAINTFQAIGHNPTAIAFCSGAVAGTAATLATYPFDICRTAFAARGITSETSSIQSFFKLALTSQNVNGVSKKVNPLRNLFGGCGPAVLGIIPYMGLNFALYDYLVRKGDKIAVGDAGAAGAIAGGTSKLIVYPLDTVKKRLQAQTFNSFWGTSSGGAAVAANHVPYKNMVDCAARILKEEGFTTFYRGLVPTVIKTMGATGLTFSIFTFTKNTLETVHDCFVVPGKDNDDVKNR